VAKTLGLTGGDMIQAMAFSKRLAGLGYILAMSQAMVFPNPNLLLYCGLKIPEAAPYFPRTAHWIVAKTLGLTGGDIKP
jgi:hypothetical protein